MSSHFNVAEHQGYFFDIHRHQPSTSHGTTTYASSPLPSPPLSSARKPKLPSLFDRASPAGSFTIPFKSNKHIADNIMERDEYEAEYNNALELKPITHNQKAQIQMLPSIQQIVTPSNSPSPQPMTTINPQLLGHKTCNEFFDTFTASSEGSISSPGSRKASIASLLNTDDNISHAEQMDSNDIVIQIYDPDKQQKNYPTAVLAPRGRPPHSVSGNRKRRMNSDCIIHSTGSSELPSNQGMSDLENRRRKRYRSATSNKSYVDADVYIPPAAQQQQQQRAVGLRHFSEQVCKKVREKQVTTYNAVADELASDIQLFYSEGHYDQKNIRRRVYDALNVLMAMGIISKDRKEIRWLGLSSLQQPSSNELVSPASMKALEDKKLLEQKIENLQQSIKDTRQRLVHKVKQYTLFRNVVKRNMAVPIDVNKQLPLPLVALSCKKRNNLPVKVHTTSDASSITVTGNMSVTGLTNDTDLMERMGLNQINMSQYNRWFRSSWHPFCSSLVLTDSH